MFDAVDPLKFARMQALKQAATRPASPVTASTVNPPVKLQTGPATDVFFSSAKTAADIKTPSQVTKPQEAGLKAFSNLRPSAAAFMQSLKDMIPNRNQPVRVEKTTKPEFSAINDAVQKAPTSARTSVPNAFTGQGTLFGKAAEQVATAMPKPNNNQFNAFNEKLQKKNTAALAAALPFAGISLSLLTLPLAAPASMLANPALINKLVAALPTTLP